MLRDPKKLILAVIESFEEDGGRDEHTSWSLAGKSATVSVNALIEMWQDYRMHGTLPQSGGWLDQPLGLMVKIGAIDMITRTWQARNDKDFDWSKFTADQRYLITWAEAEMIANG